MLWVVQESDALVRAVADVQTAYVLDGHHRLKAAKENYEADPQHKAGHWLLGLVLGEEDVLVHSQHRALASVPPDFLRRMEEHAKIKLEAVQCSWKEALARFSVVMRVDSKLWGVKFLKEKRSMLDMLSTYRLQKEILEELLDKEALAQVEYIPEHKRKELLERALVFYVRAPTAETVRVIADLHEKFPAKATWIEPKPCSHMVIRMPDQ